MRARWKVLMDSRARSCCSSAYLTRYTYTSFFSCRRHKRQTQINSKALKSCVVIIIKQYVISVTICLRRFRTNTAEEDLPEVTQTQTLTDEIMFQSFIHDMFCFIRHFPSSHSHYSDGRPHETDRHLEVTC